MNPKPKKLKTLRWAFSLAWRFDWRKLVGWYSLGILVALLPSISLIFNRQVVALLTAYIMDGTGSFAATLPSLLAYGGTMILIGLSARVNNNLVYMMMYDMYYLGMMELAMDQVPKIRLLDLMKKDIRDKYSFAIQRPGSITDIISISCQIMTKFVMIASLLMVAFDLSIFVFLLTLVYVVGMFIMHLLMTEDDKLSWDVVVEHNRRAEYYEMLPFSPGIAKENRVFHNEEKIVEQWHQNYDLVDDHFLQNAKVIEKRNFISGIVYYVFLIGIIIYSLIAVANRTMTADVFLVLYTLCMNIFQAILGFAREVMTLNRGLQAAGNQLAFYEMPIFTEPDDGDQPLDRVDADTVFRAEHLTFGYTADKTTLDDLNFSIKRGEVIALVGTNGSGKTTLTKLLLGMFAPTGGKLWLYGKPYIQVTRQNIRECIGVFFQDYYIFHHTLRENVGYGDVKNVGNDEKIREAIRKGGAEQIVAGLPSGLDTLLNRDVDKSGVVLSGGQNQRVAVSRAHMSDREVLIFDEPAAMLDPLAEMQQFMNIKESLHGRTAVLISHRVGFARLADRIFMMDGGRLAEVGTHEELVAKNGLYAHFFAEQAQWYHMDEEGNA